MARGKKRFTLRGRDAGSGRFIKLSRARRRKRTAVIERIPIGKRRKGK